VKKHEQDGQNKNVTWLLACSELIDGKTTGYTDASAQFIHTLYINTAQEMFVDTL
jgi:hypothetical protein